ncbi:MAG TPA: TetR-like C-terminal domain-containing protein [Solirubrobacteraceae bacterium]|nr:TetR-like C-terminal domain-containing protein [Solirubrobacteraceae bacterium]
MARAGLDADAIVATAAVLADAEGLAAVTLARLATELGVRAPSLYAHIGGLDDLRRRLAARGARELAVTLGASAQGRAGSDALRAVCDAYRAYARAHPGTYTAAQRPPEPSDRESADAAEAVVGVVLAVLRGYELEGEEAIHGARIVRSALHGFVGLEIDAGFGLPISLDDTYARLVAVLDRGLASTAGGRASEAPPGDRAGIAAH